MFTFSQSFNHALRALACLERGGCDTTFVKDIAACAGVPPAYLSKIFTRLVEAGILSAKRGWKGGNHLARPAAEISLYEIAAALDGGEWLEVCLLGRDSCATSGPCALHDFWRPERDRIAAKLRETTLAMIIAFERGQPPITPAYAI